MMPGCRKEERGWSLGLGLGRVVVVVMVVVMVVVAVVVQQRMAKRQNAQEGYVTVTVTEEHSTQPTNLQSQCRIPLYTTLIP